MNMVTEDFKDMLEAESALALTFGTDLFIGRTPSTPSDCVTLFDTPSFPPDLTMDASERYYTSALQVQVRNSSYLTGMGIARNIFETFHGRAHETWNGTIYSVITAAGEPALLDWDENNRAIFIINFNLQRR